MVGLALVGRRVDVSSEEFAFALSTCRDLMDLGFRM